MKRFYILFSACVVGAMFIAPGGRGQNSAPPVKLRALPDKQIGDTAPPGGPCPRTGGGSSHPGETCAEEAQNGVVRAGWSAG